MLNKDGYSSWETEGRCDESDSIPFVAAVPVYPSLQFFPERTESDPTIPVVSIPAARAVPYPPDSTSTTSINPNKNPQEEEDAVSSESDNVSPRIGGPAFENWNQLRSQLKDEWKQFKKDVERECKAQKNLVKERKRSMKEEWKCQKQAWKTATRSGADTVKEEARKWRDCAREEKRSIQENFRHIRLDSQAAMEETKQELSRMSAYFRGMRRS